MKIEEKLKCNYEAAKKNNGKLKKCAFADTFMLHSKNLVDKIIMTLKNSIFTMFHKFIYI